MQIDMHYYGIYCLARAAGLNQDTAKTVATASQFVDDNNFKKHIHFRDGGSVYSIATAHEVLDAKNLNEEDQRNIWVPFHFMPGNQGADLTERLTCKMDSPVARQMIKHVLSLHSHDCFVELAGIAAHVYADTFSHYGFSGISSRKNRVINESIIVEVQNEDIRKHILKKKDEYFKKHSKERGKLTNIKMYKTDIISYIKSFFGENLSGALGHAAVAEMPDRPYLKWSFTYEKSGCKSNRNNADTYFLACEKIYEFFVQVGKKRKNLVQNNFQKHFQSISKTIRGIIEFEGITSERITQWREAAGNGKLLKKSEMIPCYEEWDKDLKSMDDMKDSKDALTNHAYRFHQAASLYHNHVMRELLPEAGLVVI